MLGLGVTKSTLSKLFLLLLSVLFVWLLIEARPAHAATFTVSNTNDSGGGSLRQAITDANADTGTTDTINFGVGSGCVQIVPTAPMPIIAGPVTIDGTTQSGCSGRPPIELSGNGAGGGGDRRGFWVSSANVTIKGFIINRWAAHGIWIDQSGVTISNNWVGLNSAGTGSAGNGDDGIGIYKSSNHTIGPGNVISGNPKNGIGITAADGVAATGTVIKGNYIGTNSSGNAPVANSGDGILINDADGSGGGGDVSGNIIGGTSGTTPSGGCTGDCNVISGNTVNGVGLWHGQAQNIQILGNHIGMNAGGDGTVANGDIGIEIQEAPNNQVGNGTANGRNVISGNLGAGIFLTGNASSGNVIIGNYIGTNSPGNLPMGNVKMGIGIGYSPGIQTAHHNRIGGNTGTTPNGGCSGDCNVISGNHQNGILMTGTGGNTVYGNHIGLNAGGDGALGNRLDGIGIVDTSNNQIGSTASANYRNKISTNSDNGIILAGSLSGNRIEGNYIGESSSGGPAGNAGAGVMVSAGVDTAILGNNIAYNGKLGIDLNYNNVSANDANDGDGGANRTQNFQNLYAAINKGGTTYISGHFNSNPSGAYRFEFFSSDGCNAGKPLNFGEGQRYIGGSDATTDIYGNTAFSFSPSTQVAGQQYITATATKKVGNTPAETSEFSQCILVNVAKPALTDGATWFLKYDLTSGAADKTFGYGFPAQFMLCAWDADQPGVRLPVIFADGTWFMRASYTTGTADRTISFGSAGDQPVCGDWTGNGVDRIGVVNPDMNWNLISDNVQGAPLVTPKFHYGGGGAKAIVGDWDGNGTDTVGVVDPFNTWNLRNSLNDGPPDAGNFHYGSGRPVIGDWDGNGYDTVGVVSTNGHWALTNYLSDGASQVDFDFNYPNTYPLIW